MTVAEPCVGATLDSNTVPDCSVIYDNVTPSARETVAEASNNGVSAGSKNLQKGP